MNKPDAHAADWRVTAPRFSTTAESGSSNSLGPPVPRTSSGEHRARPGAEVKVTRSSRDAGVDAVAFDPDPIRGGKFVIQAKRYTNVVPVSAVRDLYGTMINEGASKGILVTTSHYGRDSREFAQNKPMTLIDGTNLVYLLEQHGHRVRIDLEAARRSRRAE